MTEIVHVDIQQNSTFYNNIFSFRETNIESHQDLFCKSTQRTAKNIIKNIDIEITLYKYVECGFTYLLFVEI